MRVHSAEGDRMASKVWSILGLIFLVTLPGAAISDKSLAEIKAKGDREMFLNQTT